VEFESDRVQVQVCVSTDVSGYSFLCPGCSIIVNKPATERVVAALEAIGVPVVHWSLPAELFETKVGPPITHDDLLSFHMALATEDWQAELAGLPPAR
jgi:hypothetical protein